MWTGVDGVLMEARMGVDGCGCGPVDGVEE